MKIAFNIEFLICFNYSTLRQLSTDDATRQTIAAAPTHVDPIGNTPESKSICSSLAVVPSVNDKTSTSSIIDDIDYDGKLLRAVPFIFI